MAMLDLALKVQTFWGCQNMVIPLVIQDRASSSNIKQYQAIMEMTHYGSSVLIMDKIPPSSVLSEPGGVHIVHKAKSRFLGPNGLAKIKGISRSQLASRCHPVTSSTSSVHFLPNRSMCISSDWLSPHLFSLNSYILIHIVSSDRLNPSMVDTNGVLHCWSSYFCR